MSVWTFYWTVILHNDRVSPELVVINLNCISDWSSYWTVVFGNNRVASLLRILSEPVVM